MKQIGNVKYYSKKEVAARIGCCAQTLNNKIAAGNIQGTNFGRFKYYTEKQIEAIINTRTYIAPKEK